MREKGYIALISTIIISAVLIAIASALSFYGFENRYNALDYEFKEKSKALAEGCVNTAILKLAENPNFKGNETINIENDFCLIREIKTNGLQKIIETQSTIGNAYTNLKITVDQNTLSIISFEEIPKF